MEEEYRWEKSEKCCCLSIQLQSHWQLQKLISKTYATIPRNLTNSATIAIQQKPAERRAESGRRSAEKGVRQTKSKSRLYNYSTARMAIDIRTQS